MENFKLQKYVNEKRIAGLSDKQIATSLGMSLKHLNTLLGKKEPVKENKETPPVARVGMAAVSGAKSGNEPKDKKPDAVPPKPENANPVKPDEKETLKEQKHGWIDAEH